MHGFRQEVKSICKEVWRRDTTMPRATVWRHVQRESAASVNIAVPPCFSSVCSTLFDEVCKGCGRTATEVSNWVFLSDEEKRAVWVRIEQEGTAMRFKYDKL
jgi:predicted Fe-S protein YdhL (DUF1289 family)